MFTINFEKGFRISFWINIIFLVLIVILGITLISKNSSNNEINLGLSNMEIKEANIDFYPTRYAYSVTVDETVDKLTFTNIPESADAVIEINGNENLKVGYNQVSVTVKSKKSNPVIYYIDVDKID